MSPTACPLQNHLKLSHVSRARWSLSCWQVWCCGHFPVELEWLTTLSGKKGVTICVGYFSVNRGKENSQNRWNKRIEKEQEDSADNVLQTPFSVSIMCASSGNKSSEYPSNNLKLEFLLLQITVAPLHGQSLAVDTKRGWQITGFFPELWDYGFVRWCHQTVSHNQGHTEDHGGLGLEYILLTWRTREVPAYCPSVIYR